MRYEIRLDEVDTKQKFHEAVRKSLPTGDCYGNTLDALYDVLSEKRSDMTLILTGCRLFKETSPAYFRMLERVLEDSGVIYEIIMEGNDE